MFQDLGKHLQATKEEANECPSLPQEVFNSPRFQDFDFGNSNGPVPFVASGTKPLTLLEPIPEPVSTGIFNIASTSFASTSLAQPPPNTFDLPQFGQVVLVGLMVSRSHLRFSHEAIHRSHQAWIPYTCPLGEHVSSAGTYIPALHQRVTPHSIPSLSESLHCFCPPSHACTYIIASFFTPGLCSLGAWEFFCTGVTTYASIGLYVR